jgi:hypothetical protein
VLARKRLRESGASSLLESTSRSQSFKLMNNLSVQSTNRFRQRSDQRQEITVIVGLRPCRHCE